MSNDNVESVLELNPYWKGRLNVAKQAIENHAEVDSIIAYWLSVFDKDEFELYLRCANSQREFDAVILNWHLLNMYNSIKDFYESSNITAPEWFDFVRITQSSKEEQQRILDEVAVMYGITYTHTEVVHPSKPKSSFYQYIVETGYGDASNVKVEYKAQDIQTFILGILFINQLNIIPHVDRLAGKMINIVACALQAGDYDNLLAIRERVQQKLEEESHEHEETQQAVTGVTQEQPHP